MQIPKDTVVEFLRSKGQERLADQAAQHLPDQVDPEQHRDLLQKVGVNPDDLAGSASGLLGGLKGKLGL
jgi:hypothetical protein